MYGKGHGTGQRQRSGGNGIEHIADGVLRIGKRCIQAAVTGLHRHGQDNRACIGKASLQVADSRAACGRSALECKRAYGVSCFVQQLG